MQWDLPPWIGNAILHADMLAAGHAVCWADPEDDPEIIEFRKVRDSIRTQYRTS